MVLAILFCTSVNSLSLVPLIDSRVKVVLQYILSLSLEGYQVDSLHDAYIYQSKKIRDDGIKDSKLIIFITYVLRSVEMMMNFLVIFLGTTQSL